MAVNKPRTARMPSTRSTDHLSLKIIRAAATATDYPYLEAADISAALEYAAAIVKEREVPIARPG
jgi:hypothetical protein